MENKYKLWVARDKNGFLFAYEDNKKKRSTLPVVGCVCALASDLCFLDDIQLRTLEFLDRKKVL